MIIFSDLDNCMLDSGYTASELRNFVRGLISRGIKLAIVSSKTEREIIYHLDELGIETAYAAENGCLIVVGGKRYESGTTSDVIKKDLLKLAQISGVEIELLSEMENEEIKRLTNLPEHIIPLAKERDFSQPFRVVGGNQDKFSEELRSLGYSVMLGGRFYQISKGCSKGKAVRIIREHISGYAIGIGESENDFPMLDECDYPVILRNERSSKYRRFKGYGPRAWEKAVKKVIEEING